MKALLMQKERYRWNKKVNKNVNLKIKCFVYFRRGLCSEINKNVN